MHLLNFYPQRQHSTAHRMRGFSLMEVMVVVSILGILAALAAPSFQPLVDKWRMTQAIDSMKSTIYYARSEAIKRGGRIGIQKNAQGTDGCQQAQTNEEWGCGWFVFVDSDGKGNGKWNKGKEEVLQTVPPLTNINVIHKGKGTNIKVDRYGKMDGFTAKSLIFSSKTSGVSASSTRTLCISAGGRIKTIEKTECTN